MKGYDKPDPADGSNQPQDQDAKEDVAVVADQVGERENLGEKNVDNVDFNPLSPTFESNVPFSQD